MESRKSLLDNLFNNVLHFEEHQDVKEYRQTSAVYKRLRNACLQPGTDAISINVFNSLNNATTFADMLKVLKFHADIENMPFSARFITKTGMFFASYFSPSANFEYYLLQLKNDIEKIAVSKGYSISIAEAKSEDKALPSAPHLK